MSDDVYKIAETLGLAGMRFNAFAMQNTSGLDLVQRAKLDVDFRRAARDISICEADLEKAIEYHAGTGY